MILSTIAEDNGILRSRGSFPSVEVLTLSFRMAQGGDFGAVYEFLDNCVMRLVRKPVVYYELRNEMLPAGDPSGPFPYNDIDLLLVVLAEQWPHLNQSKPSVVVSEVAAWMSNYMDILLHAGGSPETLSRLREQLQSTTTDPRCRRSFEETFKHPLDPDIRLQLDAALKPQVESSESHFTAPMAKKNEKQNEAPLPPGPPPEREDHPELYLWRREEVQDAIDGGVIGDLALCLCSQHKAIRRESLMNIRNFMGRLEVGNLISCIEVCLPK